MVHSLTALMCMPWSALSNFPTLSPFSITTNSFDASSLSPSLSSNHSHYLSHGHSNNFTDWERGFFYALDALRQPKLVDIGLRLAMRMLKICRKISIPILESKSASQYINHNHSRVSMTSSLDSLKVTFRSMSQFRYVILSEEIIKQKTEIGVSAFSQPLILYKVAQFLSDSLASMAVTQSKDNHTNVNKSLLNIDLNKKPLFVAAPLPNTNPPRSLVVLFSNANSSTSMDAFHR
jgi:hypothetical protein